MMFPKPVSRAGRKRDLDREKARRWADVKRLVKLRDGFRCRACGSREAVDGHHITFRSAGGGDSTANVACLCRICHAELHAYRLTILGDNADLPLTFVSTAGAASRKEKATP